MRAIRLTIHPSVHARNVARRDLQMLPPFVFISRQPSVRSEAWDGDVATLARVFSSRRPPPRTNRRMRDGIPESTGNFPLHLPFGQLERGLEALVPPKDAGTLALIVSRGPGGRRETPERVVLTPERGVPGDA